MDPEPNRAGRTDGDAHMGGNRPSLAWVLSLPQKWGACWGPNPFERLNYLNPSPFLFLFDVGHIFSFAYGFCGFQSPNSKFTDTNLSFFLRYNFYTERGFIFLNSPKLFISKIRKLNLQSQIFNCLIKKKGSLLLIALLRKFSDKRILKKNLF